MSRQCWWLQNWLWGGGSKRIVLVHYFHLCGIHADCEGWESFHIARFWVFNRNASKNENIFRQQGQNKLAEMFLQQKSTVTPFDKHTKMELLWMWPSLEKHKNVLQRRGKGFLFQSQYGRLDETLKMRVSLSSPQKLVFFKISQRRDNFHHRTRHTELENLHHAGQKNQNFCSE